MFPLGAHCQNCVGSPTTGNKNGRSPGRQRGGGHSHGIVGCKIFVITVSILK